MSIPPLVCSTPPPPDQCEDDKDAEDFDLQYNLSQDDDYDYGNFSTYNHFQSAISNNKPLDSPINNRTNNNVNNGDSAEVDKDKNYSGISQLTDVTVEIQLEQDKPELEVKLNNIENLENERIPNVEINQDVESKLANEEHESVSKRVNNEEEINIEDLNLTVEEEESLGSSVKNEVDGDTDSDKFDSSDKDKATYIPDDMTSSIDDDKYNKTNETAFPLDDITTPDSSINIENAPNPKENHTLHSEDPSDKSGQILEQEIHVNESADEIILEASNSTNILSNETDDFGDFTDFNFTTDNKPSTVLAECDNPWKNNEPDSQFGLFEAHFEVTENMEPPLFQEYIDKSVPESQTQHVDAEDDDDFGDFDDFKSSMQENTDKEEINDPLSHVPVLDFQTSDNESQILENINKILYPIFQEDVPEPDSVFDGKLEALLCETWGHLLETDVRQPYIVNWNSSFGQKTLLKALCIDSRNILFGPKWSYNMPKYAANLSSAPLQPQKHSKPSGPSQPEANPEKNTKPSSTWSDPFTSDGQESSNKENNAVAPKRPTELDVFEPGLSTKPEKIYSSTLGVQPLRQINLPDTHIFTPTDSETPRSKTIHYDEPSIFLSQSSVEETKKPIPITISESSSNVDNKSLDDGDYSDFQDFKGSFSMQPMELQSTSGPPLDYVEPPAIQQPSTSATHSIGILQPIKIEPTMPTLNWPSPGEVKETFDDFSEFASHSTWNNGAQDIQAPNVELEKTHNLDVVNFNTLTNSIKNVEDTTSNKNVDSFDDDFDTFQSALPTSNPTPVVTSVDSFSNMEGISLSQNNSSHFPPKPQTDLDNVFSNIDIVKSDAISLTRPNDILTYTEPSMHNTGVENTSRIMEPIAKIPAPQLLGAQAMTSNVLQPTVTSSPIQPNTTQILQPLSLESFSQINWPNPGINLQDLSRFNPVETLNSLKSDLSVSGNSKGASPVHHKSSVQNHPPEDDIWGEFVSSKPKPQQSLPKKVTTFGDDDEWTDFVSSPTVPPQNGVNTISFNVHTNLNLQKSIKKNKSTVQDQALEIPSLNYITPKSSNHSSYNNRHFQNL